MKTTSYLRIFIASLAMTAIACSDPIEDPLKGGGTNVQSSQTEYYTSVTTWVQGTDGRFTGLVTQTPATNLATADVFVVRDGKRIRVDRWETANEPDANYISGEYFWATIRNNVLLLNYIGKTTASPPPFPLEVIIVY